MRLLEILDHRPCGAAQDEPLSPGQGKPSIPAKVRIRTVLIDVIFMGNAMCTNCARIQSFHSIRVTFERKADSPICWKRC
jgi:hypothetical protein